MIISRRILFQNSKWEKMGSCNYWSGYSAVVYSEYYGCYVIYDKNTDYSYVSFTSDFKTFKTLSLTACISIDSKTGQVFYTDSSSGRADGGGFTEKCIVGSISKTYTKSEQTIETVQPIGSSGFAFVYLTPVCRMGDYLIFNYGTCGSPSASGIDKEQNWAQKYAYSKDNGATWTVVTIGHGENVLNGRYDDIESFGYNDGKYIVYAEFDTCYKFLVYTTPTNYTAYSVERKYSTSNPYYGDAFYLNGTWYIVSTASGYSSTDGHTFANISNATWINKSTVYLPELNKYLTARKGTGLRLYDNTFSTYKEISFPNKAKLNSLIGVVDGVVYVQTTDKYIYSALLEDLVK